MLDPADDRSAGLTPLLDLIVEKVTPPEETLDEPLCMQVATLDYDDYLGFVAVGQILEGRIKMGDRVLLAHRDGSKEEFRVPKGARSVTGPRTIRNRRRLLRQRHRRRHTGHDRAQRR